VLLVPGLVDVAIMQQSIVMAGVGFASGCDQVEDVKCVSVGVMEEITGCVILL